VIGRVIYARVGSSIRETLDFQIALGKLNSNPTAGGADPPTLREQTQAEAVDRIGRAQRRMRTANRSLTRSTILIIAVNVFTMTPLGFALLSYVVGVRLFLIGITQLFSVWRAREWAVRTVAKKGTNSLISVTTPSKRSANSSRGIPAVYPAPARGNEAHQP
jgi:hypothetical protein